MSVKIEFVEPGTPAERIGIIAGSDLLTIDRHEITDALDLMFYTPEDGSVITWKNLQGELHKATLAIYPGEHHGIVLEDMDIKRCRNNCQFCFVHQLPKGLRKELYVKDEDFRLSFLYGNYVTGTNLSDSDLKRIVKQRLSPIYISIHATDPEVRSALIGLPQSEVDVFNILKYLSKNHITIHTQIVLCPGLNDGPVLEKTVRDLAGFCPAIQSIAVVPLGLTSHRKNLPILTPITRQYISGQLSQFRKLERQYRLPDGERLVYFSDEFYLISGQNPPMYSREREFPQLDNGVGMYALFYRGMTASVKKHVSIFSAQQPFQVGLITSVLGEKVLEAFIGAVSTSIPTLSLEPIVVTNSLLGESVTVTGLLPGRDIREAINAHPHCDVYILPENCLRPEDRRLIDDMLFEDIQPNVRIAIGPPTATGILELISNLYHERYGEETNND